MSNTKKTTRKNKTNQSIIWPDVTDYFTIASLTEKNQHMLTVALSDITLRVHLQKAITETKLVSEIGYKNTGKGRPIKAFAMTPVSSLALEKAVKDGITLKTQQTVPVMEINPIKPNVSNIPLTTVNINKTETVKV